MRYSDGAKIIIGANVSMHEFEIGEKVQVIQTDDDSYYVESMENALRDYITDRDIDHEKTLKINPQ